LWRLPVERPSGNHPSHLKARWKLDLVDKLCVALNTDNRIVEVKKPPLNVVFTTERDPFVFVDDPVGRERPSRDPLEHDDVDPLDDPDLCIDAPQRAFDAA
jgi:hypothetical protein